MCENELKSFQKAATETFNWIYKKNTKYALNNL